MHTIFTIDTINQLVTLHAYLLCIAEKLQQLVRFFSSYPQLDASYQQAVVDGESHYKTPGIKADFIAFNWYPLNLFS